MDKKLKKKINESIDSKDALLMNEEKLLLFTLIYCIKPNKVLEIGSYKGGSAEIICKALDINENGNLVLIDIKPKILKKIWSKIKHRTKLFIGTSDILKEKLYQEKFDFIFIDGDHHYDAVIRDSYNALQVLNNNGYIIYHDCHFEQVKKAIEYIIKNSNLIDCGVISTKINHLNNQMWGGFRLLKKASGKELGNENKETKNKSFFHFFQKLFFKQ